MLNVYLNNALIFNSPKYASLQTAQISKQNSLENITYQMRYEWVNRSAEYVLLTD